MIRVEDFLPNYPDISDRSFQQKLYNKEEFFRYKLAREQEQIQAGEFLNQQIIGSRYISPFTQYDGVLVFHQQGVGKTCYAYAIAEGMRESGLYKRCLIFARGRDLILNIMRSFVYSCSQHPELQKKTFKDLRAETHAIKKILKAFYSFNTFLIFSRELASLTDEQIAARFSNTVVIIDEVHNIAANDLDKSVYSQFHRLFHIASNCRKLIMSATPMSDDVAEIATIMNLLLPLPNQLPTGADFKERFLTERGDGTYVIRPETEGDLRSAFRGRISYLLARYDNIEIIYDGAAVPTAVNLDIPEFRAVSLDMTAFQSKSYMNAFGEDTNDRRGIYNNSRQASLFVFPDGSWGQQGLKSFATIKKTDVILNKDFKKLLRNIKNLEEYSVKYAAVLSEVSRNPRRNIYVYCSVVNGSGAKLLAQIMELYGYARCRGTEPTKGKRYMLLTGDTPNITLLVKYFNSARNVFGEYCQVIIGSKKISEGFSFHNIQIAILLTFHWNYTETSQAQRRAARYGSHRILQQQTTSPIKLVIKQLASVPREKSGKSIDYMMIDFSIRKDISIKRMERICQEMAFDCPLNYERNVGTVSASRDCNYQECEYKCDSSTLERTDVDYSTYELYYSNFVDLVPRVSDVFKTYSPYTYEVLKDIINPSNDIQLLKCLSFMIENNVIIYNTYSYPCYLREKNNVYFLTGSDAAPYDAYPIQSGTYIKRPLISKETTLTEYSTANILAAGSKVLDKFISRPPMKLEEFVSYLNTLPQMIVDLFVQAAIVKILKGARTRVTDYVLQHFDEKIYFPRSGAYIAVYEAVNETFCCKAPDFLWVKCEVARAPEERKSAPAPPDNTRYIGITENDKFCIQDLSKAGVKDKRARLSGAVCQQAGWPKARLVQLVNELGIDANERMTKAELCAEIREYLDSKGLVRQGKCGTARKKK